MTVLEHFPNHDNIRFSDFGVGVKAPAKMMKPSLLFRVLRIVLFCTQKKMVGVHAKWSVALVANAQTRWNFTAIKKPVQPVGENDSLLDHDVSVAFGIFCPCPKPAVLCVSFFKLVLDSLLNGFFIRKFPLMFEGHFDFIHPKNDTSKVRFGI